jgi:hypothetical protein
MVKFWHRKYVISASGKFLYVLSRILGPKDTFVQFVLSKWEKQGVCLVKNGQGEGAP